MVNDPIKEVIFVGLPGPTHNYGGLSADNVASSSNRGLVSNPREAALQALGLANTLTSLGLVAAILPPQLRPHLGLLRTRFTGSDEMIINQAAQKDPILLEKACSSSAMWTANAATVTAAADNASGALHLTTANLYTNVHRRIEAEDTHRVLSAIFAKAPDVEMHAPLPAELRDEGAANHMRLAPAHDAPGLNIFVYGTDGSAGDPPTARQTLAASKAIAQHHGIPDAQALFLKQHPALIRQGVFHNDVIAVANGPVLLAHEMAYNGGAEDLRRIEAAYQALHPGAKLHSLVIRTKELSVEEAVRTYFFNSQIVTTGDGMVIVAPMEVKELYDGKAAAIMQRIVDDEANPVVGVRYIDLRQSMNNGGGPACLRLRVPMNDTQLASVRQRVNVIVDDELTQSLRALIADCYPEALRPQELANPDLYHRCRKALAAMAELLKLPLLP